jgi:carotenoid 1,2-hydratase
LSDDGCHGLTLIAFVGSVFSPYYAYARRRGAADPQDHCAVNVCLYGASGRHWALTERSRRWLRRDASTLEVGPSAWSRTAEGVAVRFDEVAAPWPRRLVGTVQFVAAAWTGLVQSLEPAGRHRWMPLAPCGRVAVRLAAPALAWEGNAYLDSNAGDEPLESAIDRWDWSRASLPDGSTVVAYDVVPRSATDGVALALRFRPAGAVETLAATPLVAMPRTLWGIERRARASGGAPPRIERVLEDAPFYARTQLATTEQGAPARVIHESLSLARFRRPWVQGLLPFRMPRRR